MSAISGWFRTKESLPAQLAFNALQVTEEQSLAAGKDNIRDRRHGVSRFALAAHSDQYFPLPDHLPKPAKKSEAFSYEEKETKWIVEKGIIPELMSVEDAGHRFAASLKASSLLGEITPGDRCMTKFSCPTDIYKGVLFGIVGYISTELFTDLGKDINRRAWKEEPDADEITEGILMMRHLLKHPDADIEEICQKLVSLPYSLHCVFMDEDTSRLALLRSREHSSREGKESYLYWTALSQGIAFASTAEALQQINPAANPVSVAESSYKIFSAQNL